MTVVGRKRIAFFQAEWPVQSQTAHSAILLGEAGYDVDIFLSKTWSYVAPKTFETCPRVHVYDLSASHQTKSPASQVEKIISLKKRLKRVLIRPVPGVVYERMRSLLRSIRDTYLFLRGSEEGILPLGSVEQAVNLMAGKSYHCLVGVEKKGLIWAGHVAAKLKVPFIYYSLELYTDDFERVVVGKSIAFKRSRKAERRYHSKATATIIQDPERAKVLFQDNGLSFEKATVFYLPVSLRGGPYGKRSRFIQSTLGISEGIKVVLCFGQIAERRYNLELAQVAQSFPADWILVMHGPGETSTIEKIRRADRSKRVIISSKIIPSDQIQELIASADVGLAFYSPLTQNERLTAFSSEKIALYLQCGVPFIAFDYPGYKLLADQWRCGLVVRTLEQIPAAIQNIVSSHQSYRENAYKAFSRYYDFDRNVSQLIAGLGCL